MISRSSSAPAATTGGEPLELAVDPTGPRDHVELMWVGRRDALRTKAPRFFGNRLLRLLRSRP